MKEENSLSTDRERKLGYISLILVFIILVQCIISVVLFTANRKYKVMYDEALETQINMQNEINALKSELDNNTQE